MNKINSFPIRSIFRGVIVSLILVSLSACGGSGSSSGTSSGGGTSVTPPSLKQMGGSLQGKELALTATVSSFAGSSYVDGNGTAARYFAPIWVATDGPNLYVYDSGNSVIRKVVLATGATTVLAGTPGVKGQTDPLARFDNVNSLTTDGIYVYVVSSTYKGIRKIDTSTGAVSTFAGSADILGGVDGVGADAQFSYPRSITNDGVFLYVLDYGKIRKVDLVTAMVSTVTLMPSDSALTIGAIAVLNGNLYALSYENVVTQINLATGFATQIAGMKNVVGSEDGVGPAARFNSPIGIETDGTDLFITDYGNSTVRKLNPNTYAVTTIAGSVGTIGGNDGIGAAANFDHLLGIASSGGNLYLADADNNAIRKLVIATGAVTTIAGNSDPDGAAMNSAILNPYGVTTDGVNLYVADSYNNIIRKVVIATGTVSTIAGKKNNGGYADGTGVASRFAGPRGVATDGTNLYIADSYNHSIRKMVLATGVVTTLAGQSNVIGHLDGAKEVAQFDFPEGITTDGKSVFVTEGEPGSSHTIRQISIATGVVSTIAGFDSTAGGAEGIGATAPFNVPSGITTDGVNLYVLYPGNFTIHKIVIATGAVSTIAGSPLFPGSSDGIGAAARFNTFHGITTDGTNLYVADTENHTIRKVVIATGAVTTLAGAGTSGNLGGVGSAAQFNRPFGITTDGKALFITDQDNHTIRKLQ